MALDFVLLLLAAIAAVNAVAALLGSPRDFRAEVGAAIMLLLIAAALVALTLLVALPASFG